MIDKDNSERVETMEGEERNKKGKELCRHDC